MGSLAKAIEPKSDQLNADDLIAGPITVKITDVIINEQSEQKVIIRYEGDNGKPYKPCKSMARVMVEIWGGADNGQSFIGQSMTLYRDPKVKWGGLDVGGIRISHMTGIERDTPVVLTVTKGKRAPMIIHPLKVASVRPVTAAVDKVAKGAEELVDRLAACSSIEALDQFLTSPETAKKVDYLKANRSELYAIWEAAVRAKAKELAPDPELAQEDDDILPVPDFDPELARDDLISLIGKATTKDELKKVSELPVYQRLKAEFPDLFDEVNRASAAALQRVTPAHRA